MDGNESSDLGSLYTIKRAGDDQFLDYEDEMLAQNWHYERELKKRMKEEKKREKKKFNERVEARNKFEEEKKKREEKERATVLWRQANLRRVREDRKKALLMESLNEE